jgi:predicted lipoprotein with Yx(FWY)xxD motif
MLWKRIVTGVAAVAALALTAFALSASEPTSALADSGIRSLPPASSPPSAPPRPFLSTGSGQTAGALVTRSGQALYFNDQDTVSAIACLATCALVWHPLRPAATSQMTVGPDVLGALSVTGRPDGSSQVTYDGHPLYTYTVDATGHLTGDGLVDTFDGQAYSWHAITASGQLLPSAQPGAPSVPPVPSGVPDAPPLPSIGPSGLPSPLAPSSPSGPSVPSPSGLPIPPTPTQSAPLKQV